MARTITAMTNELATTLGAAEARKGRLFRHRQPNIVAPVAATKHLLANNNNSSSIYWASGVATPSGQPLERSRRAPRALAHKLGEFGESTKIQSTPEGDLRLSLSVSFFALVSFLLVLWLS